jgi:hypothetical protein
MIVKINGTNPHYRVFATWSGGYLDGDSWKLNSGITSVTEEDGHYLFAGSSGSVYRCAKHSYGSTGYGWGIIDHIIRQKPELAIEVLPETTNVMELNYE